MKPFRRLCYAALISVFLTSPIFAADKKLIEFGWDEPDPAFMRAHLAEMERTPFDGCVFHADAATPDGKSVSFTWSGWGKQTFTLDQLQKPIADLKATPFKTFTHNFFRFNTTPADVDWF